MEHWVANGPFYGGLSAAVPLMGEGWAYSGNSNVCIGDTDKALTRPEKGYHL